MEAQLSTATEAPIVVAVCFAVDEQKRTPIFDASTATQAGVPCPGFPTWVRAAIESFCRESPKHFSRKVGVDLQYKFYVSYDETSHFNPLHAFVLGGLRRLLSHCTAGEREKRLDDERWSLVLKVS